MEKYVDVNPDTPLTQYCRNATNKEGDTFVGVKSENVEGKHALSIHFPMGYKISDTEDEVRDEIIELMATLQEYNDEQSRISEITKEQVLKTVRFPVQAYLTVMMEYQNNGFYQITEEQFKRGISGPINWARTIKQERPIPTKKGLVFPNYRVKTHNETDKDLITQINKYCVYQSHLRLGWIYKLQMTEKPAPVEDLGPYRHYLNDIIQRTNVDKDKRLFQSMLDILNFENTIENPEQFYFGTNNFEYVWEKLIQATFGNVQKEHYFPRTKWLLNIGSSRENSALEPDTIMKESDDIYILDAKYYKYGVTNNPKDLPNSSSINKQISYGEYVASNKKFKHERDCGMEVYNAFLLPYDSKNTIYNVVSETENYYSIGEAISDWKESTEPYQRVQGILVDIKWLIKNSIKPNTNEIIKLSNAIKKSIEDNKRSN